jgi:hypothetical protein
MAKCFAIVVCDGGLNFCPQCTSLKHVITTQGAALDMPIFWGFDAKANRKHLLSLWVKNQSVCLRKE